MCEKHLKEESHHCCADKGNKDLSRIVTAIFMLIVGLILPANEAIRMSIFIFAYIISGYDIICSAIKNILKGKIFDENFLMTIATIGALCLRDYAEAISVMILYQIGEYFQHKAVEKSRKSISKLMDIRPRYANIEINGIIKQVKPEMIHINDLIIVKAGERIPTDGIIKEGHSFIDTSSLTGESILKEVSINDEVLSGSVNTSGLLKIIVKKEYKDSAVSKILEMVENASKKKSKTENFITKFAKIYTPIVVISALLIVIISALISGLENISMMTERALTFLVISCPCALVISVPLTFFGGIGGASRKGILIKGSNYLEKLSKADTIAFDKTGTLTKGIFKVTELNPYDKITEEELLETAAIAEIHSNHPIGTSIKKAYGREIKKLKIIDYTEFAGKGIKVYTDKDIILAGNKSFIKENSINVINSDEEGSIVYIAKNGKFLGSIIISDEIKEDAEASIKSIKSLGLKTIMLTGDKESSAKSISQKLGIDSYYANLLPSDKVYKIEELINKNNKNKSIIFTGDGINDAPVLMRSDIGIAMGAIGSDAAIEAADIVITDDKLKKIYVAIKIAKKTMRIVKQNIAFAISIKLIFLILGGFGLMSMWGAVFSDVGVTLIAVLNSLRTLKIKAK